MNSQNSEQARIIRDFGRQLTTYTDGESGYASVDLLKDVIEPRPGIRHVADATTGELGSGTGHSVNALAEPGAAKTR